MGTSSKRTIVQPVSETMESKKKGIAPAWFGKISKFFRIKPQNRTPEEQKKPTKPTAVVVEKLFDTLTIDNKKKVNEANNEDEVKNRDENEEDSGNDDFETKIIDDNRKCGKLNSQSSRDSGYSDKNNDACEEMIASMDKLDLKRDEKEKTKNKIVQRRISRGPVPKKAGKVKSGQPYPEHRPASPVLDNQAEINQLNLQTLTGGRVTFKRDEIDYDMPSVVLPQNIEENRYEQLDMINEVIAEDNHNKVYDDHSQASATIISFDYENDDLSFANSLSCITGSESTPNETSTCNVPAEREDTDNVDLNRNHSFYNNVNLEYELPRASPLQSLENYADTHIGNETIMNENDTFNSTTDPLIGELLSKYEPLSKTVDLLAAGIPWPLSTDHTNDRIERTQTSDDFGQHPIDQSFGHSPSMYPTPPRSVTVHSPSSQFSGSSPLHASSPRGGLSPNAATNMETYQDCGSDALQTKLETLKQFKERQKEIVSRLEGNACCQKTKTKSLDEFRNHLDKLKDVVRLNLCREIAKMDIEKKGFETLYDTITDLSDGTAAEDIALAVFAYLCQRILSVESAAFLDRRGYKLLETAVIKGHNYPILTRFAVECIRSAINGNPELVAGKKFLFDEVLEGGDTLVGHCARKGDECADALRWLLQRGEGELPLFDIRHTNTEGHSALHVACRARSGRPQRLQRLRTVHALLRHGGADIAQGDKNGNDTALHHAVNDSACDLDVVLLLFSFLPQKDWNGYANKKNGSSMTPADYAKRYANKRDDSSDNIDKVLLFLKKKCRKIPLKSDSDN